MSAMTRLPHWPEGLIQYIEGRRERPFSWGDHDCAMFFVGSIIVVTGIDVTERFPRDWRGYTTQRQALSRIRRAGGMEGLAEMAELARKPVGLAQRADGVLVDIEGRPTFGVVVGNGYWCAPGIERLVFRPMSEVDMVFEV